MEIFQKIGIIIIVLCLLILLLLKIKPLLLKYKKYNIPIYAFKKYNIPFYAFKKYKNKNIVFLCYQVLTLIIISFFAFSTVQKKIISNTQSNETSLKNITIFSSVEFTSFLMIPLLLILFVQLFKFNK